MTATSTLRPGSPAKELDGKGLLIAALGPEPQPIRRIKPAPCTQACPAGVNVKAYVSLIAEEHFAEALEVIRRRCPFPAICGRICHHPCEAACLRRAADDAISIRALKRFVADLEPDIPLPPPPSPPSRRERIAVIGAGPAGLTAAYDLRLEGFPVTVFEAESEPGGMLRYGIASYRLPREVLAREIAVLTAAGVEILTGVRLGPEFEFETLLGQGYHAVLIAVGAQSGRRLKLADDSPGSEVEDALSFLRRVNEGGRSPLAGKVVVVGGGSTAVEAARTARRLGAESVEILYRRFREELLASAEEIAEAEAEGVRFRFLIAPSRLVREDDRLTALECLQVGLGEPDASGRRRPILIPGSEQLVPVDRILVAVGQEADLSFIPPEVRQRMTAEGLLVADRETALTPLTGIFAAGDAVSGPATVIEAIAAGHRAAESIRHYLLEGQAAIREVRPERKAAPEFGLPDPPPVSARRLEPRRKHPRRGREFSEVERTYSAREAVAEARRCLRCGPCGECRICAPTCGRRHIMVRAKSGNGGPLHSSALVRVSSTVAMGLPAWRPTPGRLLPHAGTKGLAELGPAEGLGVEARPVRAQIDAALCRACGRCQEVCSFGAIRLAETGPARGRMMIEAALCRGCNLCTAVCPTGAASPSALSPEWWGSRLEDLFGNGMSAKGAPAPYVILACQRRAGAVEELFEERGARVEVIRFRCVGQVHSGMLTELVRLGTRRVLMAGCATDRCRFGAGARLAQEQFELAETILARLAMGATGAGAFAADWSPNRARDPLEQAVDRLLAEEGGEPVAAQDRTGGPSHG